VKEITKRVYAAPNKTRMDKKGADYTYSFPLIYFNVEDYDSAWSDLATSDGLHYCVRLFVRVRMHMCCRKDKGFLSQKKFFFLFFFIKKYY